MTSFPIDPKRVLRWLVAVSAAYASCLAYAQPAAHQVSLVVPYAPGGPSDATARMIRPVFEKVLGKPTIVENLAGAGGSIGAARALRAADGSVILIGSPNEVILAPIGLSSVKFKADDFRLVGTVGQVPYALVGRADLPARNLDELIAYAKSNAAKPLAYGSMGPGSLNHLATEAFAEKTGIRLTHVPYKGGAPLIQDLVGGQIDFAFATLAGNVEGLIQTGKLKIYGVTTATRTPKYKAWPTIAEHAGLNDFVYSIWVGPLVSKATPEPTVQKLSAALSESLKDPEVQKGLSDAGLVEPSIANLEKANNYYRSEINKFRHTAESLKIAPQ